MSMKTLVKKVVEKSWVVGAGVLAKPFIMDYIGQGGVLAE